MAQTSAGILLYRHRRGAVEVLLVHPGGPFFTRKDAGAWSIPKGLIGDGEAPLAAALREFAEETGAPPPAAPAQPLGTFRQSQNKVVTVFAVEGDFDPAALNSNTFTTEWPPRSGQSATFPEVDRAAWFSLAEARTRVVAGQSGAIDALEAVLHSP
jgi:predicted NUDIX family NTP pyrophosphohydrolase